MYVQRNIRQWLGRITVVMVMLPVVAFCATSTITVHSGTDHTFYGFGAGIATYGGGNDYNGQSQAVRDSLQRMLYGHANFKIARLWMDLWYEDTTAGFFASNMMPYITDALNVRSDMIWVLGAWETPASDPAVIGLQRYAAVHANIIKKMKDSLDIAFEATGIYNEPNVSWGSTASYGDGSGMSADTMDNAVIAFRQELDARGLEDVKIIAPECSNVDGGGWSYINSVKNNTAAVDALGAWGFHSYNMSATKELRDTVRNYPDKEVWQTESSTNGHEEPGNDTIAAYSVMRALADINLCATHWIFFLHWRPWEQSTDNSVAIINFTSSGEIIPLQKYYYFKQIGNTILPGANLRLCTSNLSGDVNSYMYNTYGSKPPFSAVAGLNPDGSWGIAVTSVCGNPDESFVWNGQMLTVADFPDAASYDLTFHVDELASAGTIQFAARRSSHTLQDASDGTVTMTNGNITVTVGPQELVTLLSPANTTSAGIANVKRTVADRLHVARGRQAGSVAFEMGNIGSDHGQVAPQLSIYTLQGRCVATLAGQKTAAGAWRFEWNGKKVAGNGSYIARSGDNKCTFVAAR